jgi:hypothetical protein
MALMKTFHAFLSAVMLVGLPGILPAADSIPTDFEQGLASDDPVGEDAIASIASTYQNQVGIEFNSNTKNRSDAALLNNQTVSQEIAAEFEGKEGKDLVNAVVALVNNRMQQGGSPVDSVRTGGPRTSVFAPVETYAKQIVLAAIKQNMSTGGPATLDTEIARSVLTILKGILNPVDVAQIMAFGTERLPADQVDGALRTLRADYLANIDPDIMPETAKAIDTALVTDRVARAVKLSPQAMQAFASVTPAQQGESPPDTNPFFSGVTGPTNAGGFGGAGGGGGGSGGGTAPTPTPVPPPTPPDPAS